jgi:ketopantoate reductase
MRIAIYGTSGAGGYFGAQLARTGEDVTFIARGQHLEAIQAHGLYVETPAGEIVIQPAKATEDPTQVGPVDVVLLGVKSLAGGGGCQKYATYGRPCHVLAPVAEWRRSSLATSRRSWPRTRAWRPLRNIQLGGGPGQDLQYQHRNLH